MSDNILRPRLGANITLSRHIALAERFHVMPIPAPTLSVSSPGQGGWASLAFVAVAGGVPRHAVVTLGQVCTMQPLHGSRAFGLGSRVVPGVPPVARAGWGGYAQRSWRALRRQAAVRAFGDLLRYNMALKRDARNAGFGLCRRRAGRPLALRWAPSPYFYARSHVTMSRKLPPIFSATLHAAEMAASRLGAINSISSRRLPVSITTFHRNSKAIYPPRPTGVSSGTGGQPAWSWPAFPRRPLKLNVSPLQYGSASLLLALQNENPNA